MTKKELYENILAKRSFLCVGLDTDLTKIPKELLDEEDPIFAFNKAIIDATHELCVAYKINTAFYEAHGEKGWKSMKKTVDYIPKGIFKIADAKRGDIGNTSQKYAEAFFKKYNFDSITLSPYMGEDSVNPYFEYPGKTVILLALTSNEGSEDVQLQKSGKGYVFETVLRKAKKWGNSDNTMFVVGATHPELFKKVRAIVPDHFLLVPGVGAQGGDFGKVAEAGLSKHVGLLVNASRSIIYAGSKASDFKVKAMKAAYQQQREMEHILKNKGYID